MQLYSEDQEWETTPNICDEMKQRHRRHRVVLAVREETVLILNSLSSRRIRLYPGRDPSITLADLFHGRAFHESSGNGWEPRDKRNLFIPVEKRCLAAKLVLGLGQLWDSGHVLGSWDAGMVYFLAGNGVCTREIPYALCVAKERQGLDNSGLTDVESLSKLLMGIEYGYEIPISNSVELEHWIQEGLEEDLRRKEYLRVVEDCLDFHDDVRSLSYRIPAEDKDSTAIARMVIALRLAECIKNAPLPERHRGQRHLEVPSYDTLSTPFTVDRPPDRALYSVSHASSRFVYLSIDRSRPSLRKRQATTILQ